MPNRIIREGIVTSERVNRLDAPAEVFYRRLLSRVDDHGLFDGRPSILRASLYPLQLDRVRETNVQRWLTQVEQAGLVRLYDVDQKPFLKVLDTRWPVRSEAKFPPPPGDNGKPMPPPARNCAQLRPYSYSGSSPSAGSITGGSSNVGEGEQAEAVAQLSAALADAGVADAGGVVTVAGVDEQPPDHVRAVREALRDTRAKTHLSPLHVRDLVALCANDPPQVVAEFIRIADGAAKPRLGKAFVSYVAVCLANRQAEHDSGTRRNGRSRGSAAHREPLTAKRPHE